MAHTKFGYCETCKRSVYFELQPDGTWRCPRCTHTVGEVRPETPTCEKCRLIPKQ